MIDSNSSRDKWMCTQCTYLNYPASMKCVICEYPKISMTDNVSFNSDEHQVKETHPNVVVDNTAPQKSTVETVSSTGAQKWSCPACTYMNWPNSNKCVQCHTLRGQSRNTPPSSGGVSPRDNARSKANSPTEKSEQPPATGNNAGTTVSILDGALQKWFCPRCTYANWPKNPFCTMCRLPKPIDNSTDPSFQDSTNISLIGGKSSGPIDTVVSPEATGSHQKSPPRGSTSDVIYHPSFSMRPWSEETLHRIKMACANNTLDYQWLNACRGAVEGDLDSVEAYLSEPKAHVFRKLTKHDCRILNRPQIFEPGMTLLKLSTRAGQQHVLDLLASEWLISGGATRKRMPCHLSPEAAREIRHHFLETLRQGKMDFNCYFVRECFTFALPLEVEDLPRKTRNLLLAQMLDTNVQHELVHKERVINWWCDDQQSITNGGKAVFERNALFALWNRTAGDCLLDSVMQSVLGILDRDNALRSVLTDSLFEAQEMLYARWRVYEITRANALGYQLDDVQLHRDWISLVRSARSPGESLEHGHIFTLAHIFRRPIIVYSVKYIKNNRAEPIGFSNYQGVYLPLLWESEFCYRQPIVLGYTRGHFSALLPIETLGNEACLNSPHDVACSLSSDAEGLVQRGSHSHYVSPLTPHIYSSFVTLQNNRHCASVPHRSVDDGVILHETNEPTPLSLFTRETVKSRSCYIPPEAANSSDRYVVYLPLFDQHGMSLPIHFLLPEQNQQQTELLHEWLDVTYNRLGLPLACLRWSPRQHPLVSQMLDHWLCYYQQIQATPLSSSVSSNLSSTTSEPEVSASPTFPSVETLLNGVMNTGEGDVSLQSGCSTTPRSLASVINRRSRVVAAATAAAPPHSPSKSSSPTNEESRCV